MATKTSVIIVFPNAVKIWAIPPLSSQSPDFSFDHYPTHMLLPLFIIPFPDDIVLYPERWEWGTISPWYFGSSHPLYFDLLRRDHFDSFRQDSKFQRVRMKLNLKPDLSTASLRVINTSELTPHDFDDVFFQDYRVCEDTLVSCWRHGNYYQSGVYTQLTSTRFDSVVSQGGPVAKMSSPDDWREYLLYSCPASGRFVLVDGNNTVSVLDFF